MECFDQNILKFDNGNEEYVLNDGLELYVPKYNWKGKQFGVERQFAFNVQLPKGLKCRHCILQVKNRFKMYSFE